MPTKRGRDSKGYFYQFGNHGYKYYYQGNNTIARNQAKELADRQGRAEHARNGGSKLQSILFNNKIWSKDAAMRWLYNNNYKYDDVRETKHELRFRQNPPNKNSKYFVKKLPNEIELILEE